MKVDKLHKFMGFTMNASESMGMPMYGDIVVIYSIT